MKRTILLAASAAFIASCAEQSAAPEATKHVRAEAPAAAAAIESARLEADVRFLADDLLEGREAGTRGYDIAAAFVAERYRALGLAPGGDGDTYFQTVPMRAARQGAPFGGEFSLSGEGAPASWVAGEDWLVSSEIMRPSSTVEAPVVFVGYGIVTEDGARDDYAGLDVAGKIVMMVTDSPKNLNTEERAHYRSTRVKLASEKGAVGVITLGTPQSEERVPFARAVALSKTGTRMEWLDASGEAFTDSPGILARASVSLAGAQKLFAGLPASWDDIVAALNDETSEKNIEGFETGLVAKIAQVTDHSRVDSPNVVGVIRGADPQLAEQYIVITAHLDHTGVRPTEEEGDDEINNGAMDNATGVASMLEVARLLKHAPPRRSIMFIALTAEEKGLVGSDYFAHNPTIPRDGLAANINLDMPIVTYPFGDVVAFGGERSTMYPIVEAAAQRAGLALSPDPMPDQGFFTRSDQYSFVKMGVPSLYVDLGFANGGEEAQNAFLKEHYHKASDEAGRVDYEALARFAAVNYEIVRGVGDMASRPMWVKGDFFGESFGGPMAE